MSPTWATTIGVDFAAGSSGTWLIVTGPRCRITSTDRAICARRDSTCGASVAARREVAQMKVQNLGHVVLKVRDRGRAEQFYEGVLGLPIAARMERPPITFFTLGNHHDFAVMEVGTGGGDPASNTPGLAHVAFRVGETLDELREAKRHLEGAGVR